MRNGKESEIFRKNSSHSFLFLLLTFLQLSLEEDGANGWQK